MESLVGASTLAYEGKKEKSGGRTIKINVACEETYYDKAKSFTGAL